MASIRVRHRVIPVVLALLLTSGVTGCGGAFPADPDGTLDSIRSSGVLRAGASHHPPQVVQSAPETDPEGTEVDLLEAYARHLGARVEWTVASETALMEKLDEGEVDLVVGGLRDDSAWSAQAGLTRAYTQERAPDGTTLDRVIATPMGENALMNDLERWFDTYSPTEGGR